MRTGKLPTENKHYTTDMPSPTIFQCGWEERELLGDHTLTLDFASDVTYYEFRPASPAP